MQFLILPVKLQISLLHRSSAQQSSHDALGRASRGQSNGSIWFTGTQWNGAYGALPSCRRQWFSKCGTDPNSTQCYTHSSDKSAAAQIADNVTATSGFCYLILISNNFQIVTTVT